MQGAKQTSSPILKRLERLEIDLVGSARQGTVEERMNWRYLQLGLLKGNNAQEER
jgi:hypothetical protein